ncbi:MAG: phosphatidate cytidylyltransferase [Actinomycetales bacterium]|nr:phosphatidate cytidylyltransferase [Actinomycetales bacterium]
MGEAQPSAEQRPRAGRNLPAAIASGVALGVVVILSLIFYKWLFIAVIVATMLVAVYEIIAAFAHANMRVARTPAYAATIVVPSVAYVWGPIALIAATGIAILAAMIWRIRRGYEGYVRDVTASVFTIVYLPFMAGFLAMTLAADNGPQRIVVFILLTISNDIGGYAAGVLFGRHPIAPTISPKKSWEGFAGSVLLQGVVGALCWALIFDAPWWQGVIAGLVMTVTATAGDFAESAIKRDLGVKDMGTFLPGHGGMMDRFDSLIPNAFTSWALFTLFLGSGTGV